MGQIFKKSELRRLEPSGIDAPIIVCNPTSNDIEKLNETGYTPFELNRFLAEKLAAIDQDDRPVKAESIARELLTANRTPLLLHRFEMLFDPRYKINLIKLFEIVAKQTSLAVIWPGSIKDQMLIYANPSYADYHQYNICGYNVFCYQ